ncbi:MAG: outer membrane beta-barrel protein [Pseudolabrys sp.]
MLVAQSLTVAQAADWPGDAPLRGSFEPPAAAGSSGMRWDGINFGGHIGVFNADTDFSKSTGDWVAYSLRETALQNQIHPSDWSVLPSQISHGKSYGAFLGYNLQWDQVVLGVDVLYNRVSGGSSTVSDGLTRIVNPSTGTDTVTISGQATAQLKDYAAFRARAGYTIGQFLPYGFIGAAVGRFDYSRDLFLRVSGADNGTYTLSENKNGAIVAGLTAGLGLDVALTPNIFLRGEWEFIAFAEFNNIRVNTNTGRVGVGVRF